MADQEKPASSEKKAAEEKKKEISNPKNDVTPTKIKSGENPLGIKT